MSATRTAAEKQQDANRSRRDDGPYRNAESFLLNRLMNRQAGFEIVGTEQSYTKGLLIWVQPIKVRDNLQDLMLDTEVLNSINRNQQTDVKIFTQSLLLS